MLFLGLTDQEDPDGPEMTVPEQEVTARTEIGQPSIREEKDHHLSGCVYLTTALISGLIGAIIGCMAMAVVIPYLLGADPIALLQGKLKPASLSARSYQTSEIKISGGAEPVVKVAQKVMPSVVNIRVEKEVRDIFQQPVGKEKGVGSGIIIREDGYILTVNHVVRDADSIYITLPGEKDVPGKVIGRDPDNDIAVIKVEKSGLPAADIGLSRKVKVGETAVAIGSPFSLQHSVTSGIVSALERNISTVDPDRGSPISYSHLIQTDAAINPGNSGGALCNIKGEIIGMNVLIYSESGGSVGIGFAIPIDTAMRLADQIIATGKVSHPYIGVKGRTLKEEVAKVHNLNASTGAWVAEIVPDSPAARADIKVNDVIIAVDGKSLKTWDDLIASVREKKVDDKITLTIRRGKDEIKKDVVLAEKPDNLN